MTYKLAPWEWQSVYCAGREVVAVTVVLILYSAVPAKQYLQGRLVLSWAGRSGELAHKSDA